MTGSSRDDQQVALDHDYPYANLYPDLSFDLEAGAGSFQPPAGMRQRYDTSDVTPLQLYQTGVAKYNTLTNTAFEQKKCPWG